MVTSPKPRIAYLMSRFPKATETFIVREAAEVERHGYDLSLFALRQQFDQVLHPEVTGFADRVRFGDRHLARIVTDQVYWLRRRPRALAAAWSAVVGGNLRSPRFLARSILLLPAAASFARDVDEGGFDWVHAHYATHPSTVAYVIGQLTGVPYSLTAHAHDIYVDRSMLEDKLRAAAFVSTVSAYNRDLLSSLYGSDVADKTHVIRCGVDPDLFSASPDRSRAGDGTLSVVSVGSLEPYKGHIHLVEACALARAWGIDIRLMIVGDGPLRDELTARIDELGLTGRVELAGRLARDDVLETLRRSDVFALASIETPRGKKEGIPVALMEAMSVGLPVIASDLSGIPELVRPGETGLLAEPGNAHALADALRTLADDGPLRSALGARGRAAVLAEYDLGVNVGRLADLFSDGIDRRDPVAAS